MPHLAVVQIGSVQVCAGNRKHFVREIDANGTFDRRPKNFQYSAGPRTDVEQVAHLSFCQQRLERLFDLGVIDMQRPNVVPPLCISPEICGRPLGARPFDCGKPFQIAYEHGIVRWNERYERLRQIGPKPVCCKTIVSPGSLTISL